MIRLLIFLLPLLLSAEDKVLFQFGVVADCQYTDKPTRGKRMYKSSLERLKLYVDSANKEDLSFTVHLGDFIDEKEESFKPLLEVLKNAKAPIRHVLGNHDFSVSDHVKKDVPKILGMPAKYHAFVIKGWKFMVLDGNDISYHAYPKGSAFYKLADKYYKDNKIKSPKWNGAMGPEQIKWLHSELEKSDKANEKVILFSHFPVFPANNHNLWNHKEAVSLFEKYNCVKAYINGHNHKGNYAAKQGIHYYTQKGMVENKEATYSFVSVTDTKLIIKGFGAEKDKTLDVRK